MSAFLLDEALALRLGIESKGALTSRKLPKGMTYEAPPIPTGPVARGPAAGIAA